MTPVRHDEENPFARESAWPTMPEAPLRLGRGRSVLGLGLAEPAQEDDPRRKPPAQRRRTPRLTPLIGAAAVGVGGLLTLFLAIGPGPAQP